MVFTAPSDPLFELIISMQCPCQPVFPLLTLALCYAQVLQCLCLLYVTIYPHRPRLELLGSEDKVTWHCNLRTSKNIIVFQCMYSLCVANTITLAVTQSLLIVALTDGVAKLLLSHVPPRRKKRLFHLELIISLLRRMRKRWWQHTTAWISS